MLKSEGSLEVFPLTLYFTEEKLRSAMGKSLAPNHTMVSGRLILSGIAQKN